MRAELTEIEEPFGLLVVGEMPMGFPNILPINAVVLFEGASRTLEVSVFDADGYALDLTGHKLVMSVKKDIRSGNPPLFTKSSQFSAQILIDPNPRLGKAQIFIAPEDTRGKGPRDYWYDVWLETPGPDLSNPNRVVERYPIIGPATLRIEEPVTKMT